MSGLGEILDENARLRKEMAALRSELSDTRTELATRDAMLEEVRRKAEYLAQRLELAQSRHRGPASQRYVPEGQDLLPFDTDIAPPPRAPVTEAQSDEEVTEKPKKRKDSSVPRRRNREDFAHLQAREVHVAAADSACGSCGGTLKTIGTASSFRIEWVPGHFERHDVERDKCACPRCPDQGVLTAPGPYALDRSLGANGLIARVLVDKFADHIPANRQAKRMQREGFEVGSHTLSSWICKAGDLLSRVSEAVRADILTCAAVQGDDTGMPVQDGGDGKLRKGRMWAFTDQDQVFYAFTESKAGKFPNALLEGYAGRLLLVDGGSEFNEVVRGQGLQRAGCWSHLRTYFFEALAYHPAEADLALGTLRDLFGVERDIWGSEPAAVLAARQERSRPLVEGFFEWAAALSQVTRPESTLGEALRYARNQEPELRLFLEHGELPLHNNLSELMLRQTVVGRKNWLFARSEGGAKAAAAIYTLIGSCSLQGIDPWIYLRDVLDRLLDYPANRVSELTPKQWRGSRSGHTPTEG
jgi:transposase